MSNSRAACLSLNRAISHLLAYKRQDRPFGGYCEKGSRPLTFLLAGTLEELGVLACGKVRRLPCVRQERLHGIFARIAKGAMDDIHGALMGAPQPRHLSNKIIGDSAGFPPSPHGNDARLGNGLAGKRLRCLRVVEKQILRVEKRARLELPGSIRAVSDGGEGCPRGKRGGRRHPSQDGQSFNGCHPCKKVRLFGSDPRSLSEKKSTQRRQFVRTRARDRGIVPL